MLFLFLLLVLHLATSAEAGLIDHACSGGSYTANDTFNSNLNTLLTSLSSSNSTFTTSTSGSAPNRAYGLLLCRGDVAPSDCKSCVQNSAQDILSLCPQYKQAIIWFDDCQLRYGDLSFFSVVDEKSARILVNRMNATDVNLFVKMLTELLDKVTNRAAYNSSMKFATGVAYNGTKDNAVYALAQCTRDLSADGCNRCLQQMLGYYNGYEARKGGQVFGQSCNFRYASSAFFEGEPSVSLDLSSGSGSGSGPASTPLAEPQPSVNSEGSRNITGRVLLILIPVTLGLALILIFGICFWRRRMRSAKKIHGKL